MITDKSRLFLLLFTLTLSAALLSKRALSVEIFVHEPVITLDGHASVSLILYGEIVGGDSDRLRDIINRLNENGIIVWGLFLYSPGGVLAEGLALGSIARKMLLHTSAPWAIDTGLYCSSDKQISGTLLFDYPGYFTSNDDQNCVCSSACALAWLGGVSRTGVVGFHHASLVQSAEPMNFEEHSLHLDVAHSLTVAYLAEMRAPRFIEDAIFGTASDEMIYFDAMKIPALRADPLYREFILDRCPRSNESAFGDLVCESAVTRAERLRVQLGARE